MCVHVYTYEKIYSGYVKCSDKNLAELRTKFRFLKSLPRGTCFHSPQLHNLLHSNQFYLPRACTLPPLTLTAVHFSFTYVLFCPHANLCPEKIHLIGVVLVNWCRTG